MGSILFGTIRVMLIELFVGVPISTPRDGSVSVKKKLQFEAGPKRT